MIDRYNIFRLFVIINAIVLISTGLAFALYGRVVLPLFNIAPSPEPTPLIYYQIHSFIRSFGVALVGLGLLNLAFLNIKNNHAQFVLARAQTIGFVFGFLLLGAQQVAIWNSTAGQLIVWYCALMAVGFGYLSFRLRRSRPPNNDAGAHHEPDGSTSATEASQPPRAWLDILPGGVALLLLVSHAAAVVVALAVLWFISGADQSLWGVFLLVLMLAVGVGFLLTLNLQRSLQLVEVALGRLNQGQPNAELALRYGWPLTKLLAHVDALGRREGQFGKLRAKWRHQIGETAAQEERNKLARDLHDSIKQQIFSISVSAAAVQARWAHDSDGARTALSDVRQGAREAMVEMNAMLQQLRPNPLEKVGLVAALHEQCEALAYRTGAQVIPELRDLPADERVPPGAQEEIFRIAQEALTNIARHARASHVWVQLMQQGDTIVLTVKDDGQGFDPGCFDGGMGVNNIYDRAQTCGGTADVTSKPGGGTLVDVRIPLVEPHQTVVEESVTAQQKWDIFHVVMWQTLGWIVLGLGLYQIFMLIRFLFFRIESIAPGAGSGPFVFPNVLLLGIALSIGTVVFCFTRARYKTAQLALSAGAESAAMALLGAFSIVTPTGLSHMGLLYLPKAFLMTGRNQPGWDAQLNPVPTGAWIVAAVILLFTGFMVIRLVRVGRAYLQQIPHAELLRNTKRNQSGSLLACIVLTFAVLLGIVVSLIFDTFSDVTLPIQTVWDWNNITDVYGTWFVMPTLVIIHWISYIHDRRLLKTVEVAK